jgi:hypothetical protein
MQRSGSRSALERAPASFSFTTSVTTIAATGGVLLLATLPEQLFLPAIAMFFVAAGLATAAGLVLAGYRLGVDGHHAWDVAALMVFVGFSAAIMADTGSALAALDELAATFTVNK